MKTPEEIKSGLECAVTEFCKGKDVCPYYSCALGNCIRDNRRDALVYIRDLEGLVEDLQRAYSRMLATMHMQLPLTLAEVTGGDYCWLDLPCWHEACPCDCVIIDKNTVMCATIHVKFVYDTASYGKTWRCWRNRPTQEERDAAVWEV